MTSTSESEPGAADPPKAFAALHHPGARIYLAGMGLVMMADSIEHVVSYWVIGEKFDSPALGGFAVVAHWLPFLLFSFHAGALADRFDPRRIIQIGMGLFMIASLGWAVLIATDSLRMWHAGVLLIIHGLAGVFWGAPGQMLLHDIVGAKELHSAVRLLATSRMLGLLLGPAIGGPLMVQLGPSAVLFLNVLIYLPLTIWLWRAPYGPKFRKGPKQPTVVIRGIADIVQTVRYIAGDRVIMSMILLGGAASFFIGSAFQPQMPAFARDLVAGDRGLYYSLLLGANAAGAVTAGVVLESRSLLPAKPQTAFVLVALWCLSLVGFSASTSYAFALAFLFAAGFLQLSYNSMTQSLVQIHAPAPIRGRVIGLYGTSALGLMTFSGITVGFAGEVVGVHWSLGLSAAALLATTLVLAWALRWRSLALSATAE